MSISARRLTLAATGFLIVAAFFLATEHRAHAFGLLPVLLLLACPLLHIFAHGGHGGHRHPSDRQDGDPQAAADRVRHGTHADNVPTRSAP